MTSRFRVRPRLKKALQDPDVVHAFKWFGLAILVGVVAGVAAVAFQALSQGLFELCMEQLAGYHPRQPGGEADPASIPHGSPLVPWLIVLLPTLGGLLSGFLVFRFSPEAEGGGTDSALESYHQKAGYIAWHVPIVKFFASAITLGTGGSGGREGPIAQIGAGIGSFLARRLGLSARERRILLAAGMGAGVGAIFRAPLAGALFASEIHYREPEFEAEAIIPSAISAITAYCVFSLVFGWERLFTAGEFGFDNPLELLPYTVLALSVCAGGILFVRAFSGIRHLFAKLAIPPTTKPAVGGFATGAFALLLYYVAGTQEVLSVLSFGYGSLQGALDGKVGALLLLAVAVGKILTTGFTIGSGGSGGVFGPSMVVGGCIGGAVGQALNRWFPDLVPHPGAYVLVGMAGFFAGAANTPISTIIMVSELTGAYDLLLPSLYVCTICYLALRNTTLYEKQMRTMLESPAHRGDFHFDVLEHIKVSDVVSIPRDKVLTFPENTPLGEVLHRLSEVQQLYFPILDADGRLKGIFSLNDIREFMYDEDVWNIAIVADFATTEVVRVRPDDDLNRALKLFAKLSLDELPIVAEDDPQELVGLLRRNDCVDAYNQKLWATRGGPESTVA